MILGLTSGELAAWGTTGATIVGSVLVLRRRVSRDGVKIAGDRVESRFLDNVLGEREEANDQVLALMAARSGDVRRLAELEGDLKNEQDAHARTRLEFAAFKRRVMRLYPVTREFVESAIAPPDLSS